MDRREFLSSAISVGATPLGSMPVLRQIGFPDPLVFSGTLDIDYDLLEAYEGNKKIKLQILNRFKFVAEREDSVLELTRDLFAVESSPYTDGNFVTSIGGINPASQGQGWIYFLNGNFPKKSADLKAKVGETIEWRRVPVT